MKNLNSTYGRRALMVASICLLVAAVWAAPAHASFGLVPGSFKATTTDGAGNEQTQAGAPVDSTVEFALNMAPDAYGFEVPDGDLKDTTVELPPGLLGNVTALPQCKLTDFASLDGTPLCPTATQVGVALVVVQTQPLEPLTPELRPVFNLVPAAGEPARLGFRLYRNNVVIDTKIRSGSDYGITATVRNAAGALLVSKSEVTLWGVPSSHVHDALRFIPGSSLPGDNPLGGGDPVPSGLPETPFMTNPVRCGVPLVTRLAVTSWQHPDDEVTAESASDPVSGCEKLTFAPSVDIEPSTTSAGAASGLDADLRFGQAPSGTGLATSQLRSVKVTLPEGVSINPAFADGLEACSDQRLGLGEEGPVECPNAARIGTATATTPLLSEPLSGAVYVRPQGSGDPESGDMYRLALVLENRERGVIAKLPGAVRIDSRTGQIVTEFNDNPQVPVDHVHLALDSGARAPLTMPESCGTKSIETRLTSWDGQVVTVHNGFEVPCGAGGFNPGFEAGTTNPVGGSSSPFVLRITRNDAEQNVSRIEATLPEGVLAKLAGVPLCGDAEATTGNCPAASQIGSATVGVGAGSNPLYVPQPGKAATAVYLAGPYKGAPYSLVAKVPAQAGPFDLGTVTVRNVIDVNPETAQVSVKSDPLPQILQGIPIAYRDIRVTVDRPDFTLNPTSCDPMEVKGTIGSAQGKSANVSSRFQVANCERLGFKPKLSLKLSGAPTRRGGYPKLRAELTMPKGGANIQRAQVLLPKTELLENSHIRTICTRVQYAAGKGGGAACPAASIYGYAKAWTPLLDKPLEGPVYLRSSSHQLPDLVASLDGQIHVDLVGRIDAKNARIRNTFESVPDAPVSKFVLTMQGGKKGLLANNTDLCKTTARASATFLAQNGKEAQLSPVAKVACKGKARHKKR